MTVRQQADHTYTSKYENKKMPCLYKIILPLGFNFINKNDDACVFLTTQCVHSPNKTS